MQAVGQVGRLGRMLASSAGFNLTKAALAILAKYGSAANLYLPGVGAINGITAGNWLDGIGTTAATVDNLVGLVVSAGKDIGPELFSVASVGGGVTNNGGTLSVNSVAVGSAIVTSNVALIVGKYYKVTFTVSGYSGGGVSIRAGTTGSAGAVVGAMNGTFTEVFSPAISSDNFKLIARYATTTITVSNISVRELPGAHLTQSTAANRPVLRQSGGVYSWQFDGSNDALISTMSPGDEGWICAGVRFAGAESTLETVSSSGGYGPTARGVWLARTGTIGENYFWVGVSDGIGRTVAQVSTVPLRNVTSVVSGGWSSTNVIAGVNNTESSVTRTVGTIVPSTSPITLGFLSGAALNGSMYPSIIMPTVLPTASERATLRQFIASLSGVTM